MKSTGKSTGNPQAIDEQLSLCDSCGASVYVALVRLTGGTHRWLPVDMVPWTGDRTTLRLSREPGGPWYVDPLAGPWQEHRCARP